MCIRDSYYHSGVGTEGGVVDRYIGGGIGEGLDKNIISAYYWLATRYQPGEDVYKRQLLMK